MNGEVLGIDFDGPIADIAEPLAKAVEEKYPGKYPPDLYLAGTPDRELYKELFETKRDWMRNPNCIASIPVSAGVSSAFPLLSKEFRKIFLVSARCSDLDDEIWSFFERNNFSPFISRKLLLRKLGQENSLQVKLDYARRTGITCMVEDDPENALGFARENYLTVLLRRTYNIFDPKTGEMVPNRPNLMICGELWDFAMGILIHGGSLRRFFSERNSEVEKDAGKLYEPYVSDIPKGIRSLVIACANDQSS